MYFSNDSDNYNSRHHIHCDLIEYLLIKSLLVAIRGNQS